MRGIQVFLGGALVVLIGFAVVQNLKFNRTIQAAGQRITKLDDDVKEIRLEKVRLDSEVQKLGESLAAMDDTTRAARMGQVMKEGKSIAKQQAVLDGQETRSKRTAEVTRQALADTRRRMLWTDLILGGAALIVVLTLVALRRIA